MSLKHSLPSRSEMRMMRWASGTPKYFLIHVRGVLHVIKDLELDIKFQEAMKAVESVTFLVNLAKMTYKDELKKGEETMPPSRQAELERLLFTRPKSSKR